jgi:glycosyltransferase involved in cell wall biosynthesis
LNRITVIGPTYPYKGGISHFTTLLVQHLRQDYEVDLITWKLQYPSFLYPVEPKDLDSKQVIKTDAKAILDFYDPFSWFRAAWRIRNYKPQKVILTWVTPVQAPIYIVIALLVKALSKSTITLLCHNALPHERKSYDLVLTKLMFLTSDDFIVHSEEDRKFITSITKAKPVIKAFHPSYDEFNNGKSYDITALKERLGLKRYVILFFGYIRPYKGLKYLIQAMPDIVTNNTSTSLLVVGEFWNKDKPEYDSLVKSLGLEKNVVFVDRYVPNEEIGQYFAVSDVLAAPYTSATQSGVIQMAYAFNKPVIGTAVGGLPEVIKNGTNGILIKPSSANAITDAILELTKGEKKFDFRSNDEFSWDLYCQRIEGIA